MFYRMSKLRRTKIRNDEDIRYIFEFIREHGTCKARDIPRDGKKRNGGWVRHYLTRMENFKILNKTKDKDGLYLWSIAFDLLNEDLDEKI